MDVNIKKDQVLRYLGYKGQLIDDEINIMIDEAIEETKALMKPLYTYKEFNFKRIEEGILLENSNFILKGASIKKHLDRASSLILLGLSLGHKIDRRISYYEKISLNRAILLDSSASSGVEALADSLCQEIEKPYLNRGKKLGPRFSPGYGDLDIGIQADFLKILDAERRIGLTASQHNILIPRKSITAIIPIVDIGEKIEDRACGDCNLYGKCRLAKEEGKCGL